MPDDENKPTNNGEPGVAEGTEQEPPTEQVTPEPVEGAVADGGGAQQPVAEVVGDRDDTVTTEGEPSAPSNSDGDTGPSDAGEDGTVGDDPPSPIEQPEPTAAPEVDLNEKPDPAAPTQDVVAQVSVLQQEPANQPGTSAVSNPVGEGQQAAALDPNKKCPECGNYGTRHRITCSQYIKGPRQ